MALAALRAVAGYAYFRFSNVKVPGFRDIFLYITGKGILKFDYLATAEAHQVVMLGGWLYLIVMMGVIKMKHLH